MALVCGRRCKRKFRMNKLQRQVRDQFVSLFKTEPTLVRSPGRINLIGEHTDYNDGFVMPAAIDKEAVFAIAPSEGTTIVYSEKFNEQFEIDIQNPSKVKKPSWANYLLGVLYQFVSSGYPVKPFHCVFSGDVPVGAGLSSSAAIECGFAFALNEIHNFNVPKLKLITMAQWAEHNYVGVKCGIMDQFASMMGKDGHVILLDCRSLVHQYFPIDLRDYTIVLCDTKVKHSLVDSEYNTRRSECEQGVSILRQTNPKVRSLRDATPATIKKNKAALPGKVFDRCLYVTQEIERVQKASVDLQNGDMKAFGKKMFDTHEGLSKLYEVSCKELDFLVGHARRFDGVVGARMMGGGFGGCTINLVRKDSVDAFQQYMHDAYLKEFNIDMPAYHVGIEGGTSVVNGVVVPQ
jgi:galactokinase